jgi:hypothetical protein
MGNTEKCAFGTSERKALSQSVGFDCLINCLSQRLQEIRDEYDTVRPDELKTLQGRVLELRAILDLLGGQSDGDDDSGGDTDSTTED